MFAMVCTRPDLAFTLSRLSKFCSAPGNQQMQAARYALRYLRSTTTQGIVYKAQQPEPANIRLEGFSDSDFAADIDNRRSTSGYVYTLNGSAISWRSKQQDLVTLSTMEAEYVGMTEACKESIWLQRLLNELPLNGAVVKQLLVKDVKHELDNIKVLYEDNQGAIQLADNPRHHNRSKHIDVKYHYIRELVANQSVQLRYRNTGDITADVLTKALPLVTHQKHVTAMGMH
jgi:hypothetical protein